MAIYATNDNKAVKFATAAQAERFCETMNAKRTAAQPTWFIWETDH